MAGRSNTPWMRSVAREVPMEFVAVMFTEKFPADWGVPERTPVVELIVIQEGISVGFSIE